jgi:hypothetical protein
VRAWPVIILLALPYSAAAEDCVRNQAEVLDIVPGQGGSTEVHFRYESRRERFTSTSNKYVWCIEAEAANQNVSEFKWGDKADECRYLCALIEPGKGVPTIKTDSSKSFRANRSIKFTRKNREEWRSLDVSTVSSKVFGEAGDQAAVLKTQLNDTDYLEPFKDDDGLIQMEKLSTDPKAFLRFLSKEERVFSGDVLTVTLPTNQKVADLLLSNRYETYNHNDFIRILAEVDSAIIYNGGVPLLNYSVSVRPEDKRDADVLAPLLDKGVLMLRLQREGDLPWALPFPDPSIVNPKGEPHQIASIKVVEPITYASTKLIVSFGKDLNLGSTGLSLLAPRK